MIIILGAIGVFIAMGLGLAFFVPPNAADQSLEQEVENSNTNTSSTPETTAQPQLIPGDTPSSDIKAIMEYYAYVHEDADFTDARGYPSFDIASQRTFDNQYVAARINTFLLSDAFVVFDIKKPAKEAIIAGPDENMKYEELQKLPLPVADYINYETRRNQ